MNAIVGDDFIVLVQPSAECKDFPCNHEELKGMAYAIYIAEKDDNGVITSGKLISCEAGFLDLAGGMVSAYEAALSAGIKKAYELLNITPPLPQRLPPGMTLHDVLN